MFTPEDALGRLPALFTAVDVTAAGLSRGVIYRWRDAGLVVEVSRGVYRRADAPESTFIDLMAVAARAPRAVVCLVSALVVHELTDELPVTAQFAVPRGVHPPRIAYPPVEFSRFDPDSFDVGVETFEAAPGEFVPVYSAERSVADCVRLRHRVGDAVALSALRTYLVRYPHQIGDLVATAHEVGDASALVRTIQVMRS